MFAELFAAFCVRLSTSSRQAQHLHLPIPTSSESSPFHRHCGRGRTAFYQYTKIPSTLWYSYKIPGEQINPEHRSAAACAVPATSLTLVQPFTHRTDQLTIKICHGRHIPDMYDIAHVAGWNPSYLHCVANVSCVGSVLDSCSRTYHNGRVGPR